VNDRRNGKGTYVFSNGSRYTGHWWENDIHTKGRFDYACGSYYRGMRLVVSDFCLSCFTAAV
jgi:hypothetical protein